VTLDYPTLLVAYALLRVLQAAALVYVWRIHRRYAPLRELAAGSVLAALGVLVISAPGILPPTLWAILQTVLVAAGFGIFAVGLVRLSDRPAPRALAIGWISIAILAKLVFIFVWPNNAVGVAILTVFVIGCNGYAAVCLLRVPRTPLKVTQTIIAGLLIVEVVATVLRFIGLVGWARDEFAGQAGAVIGSTMAQSGYMLTLTAVAFLLAILIAVLTNQRLQRALDLAASVDPLTGLLTRKAFSLVADRDWAQAARGHRQLSVLLLDLDHFKDFNDLHGHAAGDAVLRRVGEAVAKEIRGSDAACRFGGEEFVVLLPDTSALQAEHFAERLRLVIEALKEDHPSALPISASIGVAEKSPSEATWERLVAVSDRALYAAKRTGRNKVVVADEPREAA
jgi:diguanylate cyclase (GGDEF)-like protein